MKVMVDHDVCIGSFQPGSRGPVLPGQAGRLWNMVLAATGQPDKMYWNRALSIHSVSGLAELASRVESRASRRARCRN